MIAMPLENYPDLPRQHIATWCDWFRNQTIENKTHIFENIWSNLSTEEQTAVIEDLRLFISQAYMMKNSINVTQPIDAESV